MDKRRIHLVAWDKLCRPKERGGIGLKRASEMNKALLAKLGWRLLTNRNEIWSMILAEKYDVHFEEAVEFTKKQRSLRYGKD